MCDAKVREALGNGQADNLKMQGLGIKNCMEMLDSIKTTLKEIPRREEVRDMIQKSLAIHSDACSHARPAAAQPDEDNSLKLSVGKFLGFEAQGRAGMVISAILWAIIGAIAYACVMHARELAGVFGK